MGFIEIKDLSFNYYSYDELNDQKLLFKALDNINLSIEEGSFVAILGHNGSGKSTIAKHFTGILKGSEGEVLVEGISTRDDNKIWNIKNKIGIVFQNPDNQIVATVVEDDVAFGAENLGLPREDIRERVDFALKSVNMYEHRDQNISNLSGGQKQRVAIAGILAMQPKCIVLDEPTAMLDPSGRKEVIETIKKLNKDKGITIILITHFMEEVIDADRLIVMEKGKVVLDGEPLSVFKNIDMLKEIKLDIPEALDIANSLNKLGHDVPLDTLSLEELSNSLVNLGITEYNVNFCEDSVENEQDVKLELKNISHTYSKDTAFEKTALRDINLSIYDGDFLGIIGHTGSGKSTLIQMLNALIKPTDGEIYLNRNNIYKSKTPLKEVRQKVGVVFQYPEYQLFEETIYKDVAFAPTNMGLSEDEINKRVVQSLDIVSIDKSYYEKSPFELSGGEKRRVAIAGILAMQPDVLVFDELTAGLDPFSREEVLSQIKSMQENLDNTIVLVSHSMEDVAKVCNRVFVLSGGNSVICDTIRNVFKKGELLESIGLDVPKFSKLFQIINSKGYNFQTDIYTLEECVKVLDYGLKNGHKGVI